MCISSYFFRFIYFCSFQVISCHKALRSGWIRLGWAGFKRVRPGWAGSCRVRPVHCFKCLSLNAVEATCIWLLIVTSFASLTSNNYGNNYFSAKHYCYVKIVYNNINPFLPTVAFSLPIFAHRSNFCCPRDWRLSA